MVYVMAPCHGIGYESVTDESLKFSHNSSDYSSDTSWQLDVTKLIDHKIENKFDSKLKFIDFENSISIELNVVILYYPKIEMIGG